MGFRTTFVTTDNFEAGYPWPSWFTARYAHVVNFGCCLSSKSEGKFYSSGDYATLVDDLALALKQSGYWADDANIRSIPVVLAALHECGGVTRYEFWPDGSVHSNEPSGWGGDLGGNYTHDSCYGCSNIDSDGYDRAAREAGG